MHETIKVVNGKEIFRMVGTKGCYHVTIKTFDNGNKVERIFRTIKAAAAFCETL